MINFSTDYHLGQVLNTHTTPDSRKKLKQALFNQAWSVTDTHGEPHYCLGDVVHTYRNDEGTIQQVMSILGRLSNCIFGNHDVTNRTDSLGTLELLEPMYDLVEAKMGKCIPVICNEGGAVLTLVPHTNSQELFEKALNKLATKSHKKPELLLLHCNYESPWDNNETTLNLTEEMATKLLKRFDYILIGHEHNYREALDGRVVLLGNVHPTNFGDISDKYRWTYSDGALQKHKVWEKEKYFQSIH
jgi:DNA repair exonuclease SbcCD nuclease subunit